ncbi:MAG: UrcA family protein [Steroidobacteraceae bacterium]|jgi:UrcA family protein
MYSDTNTKGKIISACTATVMSLTCIFVVALAFIPKETVKFQDLNIDSPAGAAALYQRLHAAARHVCFAEWDKNPEKVQRAEACANEAESRTVSRLNVAELTAYYQTKRRQDLALTASLAK